MKSLIEAILALVFWGAVCVIVSEPVEGESITLGFMALKILAMAIAAACGWGVERMHPEWKQSKES